MLSRRGFQPARYLSKLLRRGRKSEALNLCGERGRPKYVYGKEEGWHPNTLAMVLVVFGSTFISTKVDL